MNKLKLIFSSILVVFMFGCNNPDTPKTTNTHDQVNSIIGDQSFIETYGHEPDRWTDNQLRIQTHLAYVEKILRTRTDDMASSTVKDKRHALLDLLKTYWKNGEYPINYDYAKERKPCFKDVNGTICAVGYLVEQTLGQEAVDEINSRFKYSDIYDMNSPELMAWVDNSGFTLEEVAMIQPAYGSPSNITAQYGISSALWTGTNGALTAVNLLRNPDSKLFPIAGIASGAGQLAYGLISFNKNTDGWYGTNEAQKAISMMNIGVGTSSLLLGTYQLLVNKRPKEKATAFNVYGYPTTGNKVGLGASFTKTF